MRTMIVNKSSIYPANKHTVFEKLGSLKTLQMVAWPFITFDPIDIHSDGKWHIDRITSYRVRILYGLIPFGTHRIHVIHMNEYGIETHEQNEHVPIWNHKIYLEDLPDGHCRYTDQVEIGAGWKTVFIYLWAKMFYAHRQRKWIRLLNEKTMDKMNL